jgi:hypothetical protein
MTKYAFSDAAGKRISLELAETGGRITIETIREALDTQGFSGFTRNHVGNLMDYWAQRIEAGDKVQWHAHLLRQTADRFVYEYYEQREGMEWLKGGLQRLGVIPYPEDD